MPSDPLPQPLRMRAAIFLPHFFPVPPHRLPLAARWRVCNVNNGNLHCCSAVPARAGSLNRPGTARWARC